MKRGRGREGGRGSTGLLVQPRILVRLDHLRPPRIRAEGSLIGAEGSLLPRSISTDLGLGQGCMVADPFSNLGTLVILCIVVFRSAASSPSSSQHHHHRHHHILIIIIIIAVLLSLSRFILILILCIIIMSSSRGRSSSCVRFLLRAGGRWGKSGGERVGEQEWITSTWSEFSKLHSTQPPTTR
eukprot:2844026-Rhodomonas_salina.1